MYFECIFFVGVTFSFYIDSRVTSDNLSNLSKQSKQNKSIKFFKIKKAF